MRYFFTFLKYFLALIAMIFFALLSIAELLFSILLVALMALIVAGIFRILFSRFRNRKFSGFFLSVNIFIWAIFGFFTALLGGFAYYHNHINPAKLSNITLENASGQKVVFVKMSHIATEKFYENKKNAITNLSHSGYIILAEGVKSGSAESTEKFNQMIGLDFQENTYEKLSGILGYAHQTKEIYSEVSDEQLVSVDISLDKIVELIGTGSMLPTTGEVIQTDEVFAEFDKFSPMQKNIFQYLMQAFLNATAKISGDNFSLSDDSERRLMEVILHDRNEPVIEYVIQNPDKNIAIVYGSLHYDGIFQALKKHDSSWRIIGVEPFVPYSQE